LSNKIYDVDVSLFRHIPTLLDKGKPGESQRRKAKGAFAAKVHASQLPKDGIKTNPYADGRVRICLEVMLQGKIADISGSRILNFEY
jgi:hypothetical protein